MRTVDLRDPRTVSLRIVQMLVFEALEAYAAFKRYWIVSLNFLKLAGVTNTNKIELYTRAQQEHDEAWSVLTKSLRTARKAL